jgi:hypothetical protein
MLLCDTYHLLLPFVPVHERGVGRRLRVPAQPTRVLEHPFPLVLLRVQHRRVVRAEPHQQRVVLHRRLLLHVENVFFLSFFFSVLVVFFFLLFLSWIFILVIIISFLIFVVVVPAPCRLVPVLVPYVRHGEMLEC